MLKDIIGYKAKTPLSKTILWALPGIVLAAVIFTTGTDIEKPLWTVFSWVPEWFRVNRTTPELGSYVALTLALNFLIRGLLVPFTEEIYFRGFLLPRMNRLGKFAPLVSAALFSANHLFTPWENITRMLAVLPFVHITWYKKDIRISIISHCTVNTLSCLVLLLSI
jgi:membrane protease YdiL (CAAX protease family)